MAEVFEAVVLVENPENVHESKLMAQGMKKFTVVEVAVVGLFQYIIKRLEIYPVYHHLPAL